LIKKTIIAAAVLGTTIIVSSSSIYASGNQCGGASWYSLPGQRTANGERMNPNAMTAAHKFLPFGTRVRVVDQNSGKSIQVTINDRGPFVRGRIIDLSRAAATRLGISGAGTGKVCLQQV
jgi:rare lipoprotein A